MHGKENPKKCTVEPLRGRVDFVYCDVAAIDRLDLAGYVRLGMTGGPRLGVHDAGRGLLILDGTWRHVARLEAKVAGVPVRTLPELSTAYPRASKVFADPAAGLATIEAIYAAYRILDRPTQGLLDQYRWAERFLELNRERW